MSLVATSLVVAAPARLAQSDQTAATDAADPATTDKSYPLFSDTCGACHDSARITSMRRTKAEWQDVIGQMIDKGAIGDEKSFETVFQYLRRYYGKVFVNSGTADELAVSLGLSDKDAQAIVDARKAAPIADFDALRKVPGIDVKALEVHKDAAGF